jgi:cytochrome c biogenesis protein CcmG/thiol:disulfide interchange protein DsbE
MKRFLPLIVFFILSIFLYTSLWLNPKELPSPLIGKSFPEFNATTLMDKTFTKQNLIGKVSLVNVWASWCVTCRAEHAMLMDISKKNKIHNNAQIIGINYKDIKVDANKYLNNLGNPYLINVFDEKGMLGLELGVYAVPETFVVDKEGIIRYKYIGEITKKVWLEQIKPLIFKLNELVIDTKTF